MLETVRIVTDFFALAVVAGTLFWIIIMPPRGRINSLLLIFGCLLASYIGVDYLRFIINPEPSTYNYMLEITSSLLVLVQAVFYLLAYVMHHDGTHRLRQQILWLVPGVAIALALIWSGLTFHPTDVEDVWIQLTPYGWGVAGIMFVYSLVMIAQISENPNPRTMILRAAAGFVGTGFIVNGLVIGWPLDIVVFSVAFLGVGTLHVYDRIQLLRDSRLDEIQELEDRLQRALNVVTQADERIVQLGREIDDLAQYRSDFLATVSHELRTPLNSIIGYSELLTSPVYGELNAHQQDRVDRIHRNGAHLSNMINSILDFLKLESGSLHLNRHPFVLEDAVENTLIKIRPLAEDKGLSVEVDITSSLPDIDGDQLRIEQVLYNLLDNSIKFTEEGTIVLRVKKLNVENGAVSDAIALPSYVSMEDGVWCLVSVEDSGIGIPEGERERIFVDFAQVDSSYAREYGGLGLGLTIALRLIELHRGNIWLESQPDTGTTFYVTLPFST